VSDRLANPWGARTPHVGGDWPARVDSFLEEGVAPGDVRWVESACLLCSNGCGLDVAVHDGRIVGVRGRAEDRVNHGRLGPKGLFRGDPVSKQPFFKHAAVRVAKVAGAP
jgi:ferredoxin-nitrate reductase